jgi:hypothetical protein
MSGARRVRGGTPSLSGRTTSLPVSSSSSRPRLTPSSSSTSEPSPLPPRDSPSSPSSPSTPILSPEAIQLKVESVLSQMGKAESGSCEVLQLLVNNANIFLKCSIKDAKRLWSATNLIAPLQVYARDKSLEDLRGFLEFLRSRPTAATDSPEDPTEESETNDIDSPEEVELQEVPSKPSSSMSDSRPGRSSRHMHHDEQQKMLARAMRFGIQLSTKDMENFSPKQREEYAAFVLSQQEALKSLGRRKPTSSSSTSGVGVVLPTPPSVHWKSSIPSIDFSKSSGVSAKSRRVSRMPRVGSKRKPTSSMDESSSHRNSQSSGESSVSPSDSSESSSSSSDHSGSSSSSSSSSSSHSSDSDSATVSRRSRRSRSGRSKRRRRPVYRSHSATSPSLGLRRFLKQQGIPTYQRLLTPELLSSMNGQTPMQWWRNIATAHSSADSRSINEGLHLCMCLLAGHHISYVRELICRRLLGLHFVISANKSTRDDAWKNASALLPLNPGAPVSLPVQQMIEKQARRSRHSSSSSQSYQSQSTRYTRGSKGRGRGGRFSQSNRDGYYSGGDRSDNGGSASAQNNRGNGRNRGRGRGNNQSGAAPASAQRGNSAGGSGAADQ